MVIPKLNYNQIVKSYILSESLLWAGWSLIIPIFAIFVVENIENGSIEIAAMGFSTYLVVRVIFELISGQYLSKSSDKKKFLITVTGLICISVAYIGFALTETVAEVFFFYATAGLGMGIASPAKNSLFSMHLDKNKESTEWGITEASVFICMALATTAGGLLAQRYGFDTLFYIAAIVNLLSITPYLKYIKPYFKTAQAQ